MTLFLTCLAAIAVFMLLMAVGVLLGREPLKGTCGGLNRVMGDRDCPVCGGNPAKCETANEGGRTAASLGYDATRKS